MVRHPEFEKIHSDFLSHYSSDPALGESRYAAWVKALSLDESKGYREQAASRLGLKESFRWAQFLMQFVKEDTEARYYKVEALFPIETLKGDTFTADELYQAARTLTGKPSNLNHDWQHLLPEIEIKAAQCEDNVVECLVRILKSSPVCGMIDRGEIVNVSIEGDWTHGVPGKGLVLSGLGWLTKDVLPGVPLTRIMPVEKIAESLEAHSHAKGHHPVKEAVKEQGEVACVFCGVPADFLISICQSCFDQFPASGPASQAAPSGVESLEREKLEKLIDVKVKERLKKAGIDEAEWDVEYINDLPDECFAFIEAGGQKDDKGKTVPRSLRHLPYKNSQGSLDADHVRNALARLDQTNISAEAKAQATKKLCAAAAELKIESALCNLSGKSEVLQTKLAEAEGKLKDTSSKLEASEKTVQDLRKQVPGGGLLKNPPKMMSVLDHIAVLERLLSPPIVEHSSMGMQRKHQEIRQAIFQAKEKLKET